MTQDEAMKCLKKYRRWMTTREVKEKTGISKGPVAKNLNRIFISNECERKLINVNRYWTYAWRVR